MKKLVGLPIILAIIVAVLMPAVVLANTNLSLFTVVESNGTNYPMLPVTAAIDNSILVSQGKIASNGLNTQVTSDGTPIPHMVANDKVLFAAPILANSNNSFVYSTKSTPDASMPIIVGHNGYFVTPYVAGMDLGTKFSVVINAYFDMTQSDTIMQTGGFYIGMGEGNLYGEIDEPDNERDFELPNVASGVHTLTMSGDGSHYTFSIDSPSDPDYQTQVLTETTGVPQSGQVWDWGSANGTPYNTMPYINSIQVQITPTDNSNNSITSMILADNYVFAGIRNNSTGDVAILKIDPELGTVVDTWDLGMTASIYGIPCLYYDGTDLYAGLGIFDRSQSQTQAMIIQFTPDLTEVNDWEDSDLGFGGIGINLLTGGDGMIYGAGDAGSSGAYGVVQIDPSDMQKVAAYTETDAGDYGGNPLTEGGNEPLNGIALVGDSLYCAETYTPGASFCGVYIIKLAFYGLDQEGAHRIFTDEMAAPYANYQAEQLTTDGTSLYCGIEETLVQDSAWVAQPYKVVKIDNAMNVFATYTTSNSLFNGVSSLLLANGKLYVGTWTNNSSNLGDIETVNPASMLTDSETWEATTGSGISGITAMIYDRSHLDAMFSSVSSSSADILQLDPTAMTLEHTINIAATALAFNLLYRPNTIIQGTDLPNIDDGTGATDGEITWGSNPGGISETGSSSPSVDTLAATNPTNDGATLNGNLTSIVGYSAVSVYFEYGLTSSMTSSTSPQNETTAPAAFSETLITLSPGLTYYFEAVCLYGPSLKAYGSMLTFDTVGNPAPTAPSSGSKGSITLGEGNTYQKMLGPTLSGILDTMGGWFGTDGHGMGGALVFIILCAIMISLSRIGYPVAGIALGFPIQLAAAWVGLWDWAFVGVTVFIFALVWAYQMWFDR